jgi:hypothetical protein
MNDLESDVRINIWRKIELVLAQRSKDQDNIETTMI